MKTEQKCEVNIIYCSRYYKLIVYGAEFCYNYNTISKSEEDEFVQIVNEKSAVQIWLRYRDTISVT